MRIRTLSNRLNGKQTPLQESESHLSNCLGGVMKPWGHDAKHGRDTHMNVMAEMLKWIMLPNMAGTNAWQQHQCKLLARVPRRERTHE